MPARAAIVLSLSLLLGACAGTPQRSAMEAPMFTSERSTDHRGSDDLLTAGLGLDGLRAMVPPAFADAAHPTAAELRRRTIWSNWRGIADLAPGGGYGTLYGTTQAVPGREFSALVKVAGASQPHRVLAQIPDAFDKGKRCVVVAPASGSRGVYGAISIAGAWGLPKGCAVAYADKGAGTDYFDLDAQVGVRADGATASIDGDDALAFVPDAPVAATGVAFKHAHSKDNPEADWGRHVKQAAQFALHALDEAMPDAAPFTFDNTRVIAVGISNGGGAVLRAAELEGDWLDAVVAGEPNVHVEGGRPIYDFATEAALLQPCALLHLAPESLAQPPMRAQVEPLWALRCASLKAAGLVSGDSVAEQAKSA
jgi:hydroxybutyrate-dimer hydrolase